MKPYIIIHPPVLDGQRLTCTYSVGEERFENIYEFPKTYDDDIAQNPMTQKLAEWVAIITSFGLFSVDYFDEIVCEFNLTAEDKAFFEKLIYLGFGEFRYVNNIPLDTKTTLRSRRDAVRAAPYRSFERLNGPLLLNGGGKDGSVSAWLLANNSRRFTWFQRGDSVAQSDVVAAWHAPATIIKRTLDPNRKARRFAGHRPMSAGIAFLAALTAHLYGHDAIIASNETSANEGNATFGDFTLNHQYSKSLEFEKDIQHLFSTFGIGIDYFSLLRPLHELQIAMIATKLNEKQLGAITSCNHGTSTGTWCMACAKCAFVVLAMTAASPEAAKQMWGDAGIINTSSLHPYLIELLDPNVDKPLECVGTLDECQLAAKIIVNNHKDILTPETYELLARYAMLSTQNVGDFINYLSESSIPARYQPVVDGVKKTLAGL